jgi:hypothetical protein
VEEGETDVRVEYRKRLGGRKRVAVMVKTAGQGRSRIAVSQGAGRDKNEVSEVPYGGQHGSLR